VVHEKGNRAAKEYHELHTSQMLLDAGIHSCHPEHYPLMLDLE
jgi:hypothetical protein